MEGTVIAVSTRGRRPRGSQGDDRTRTEHKINGAIRFPEVRVVGDNIDEPRVMPTDQAQRMAQNMGLDLVVITEQAEPPVCRIVDYQKFLYQQRKRQKEQRAKAQRVVVKEIRFGPNTDDHDYEFKLRHAERFLSEGAKVKAFVHFRGRAIVFKDQGEMLLLRFAKDLEDIARVEQLPQLEGKRMQMFLAPLKK